MKTLSYRERRRRWKEVSELEDNEHVKKFMELYVPSSSESDPPSGSDKPLDVKEVGTTLIVTFDLTGKITPQIAETRLRVKDALRRLKLKQRRHSSTLPATLTVAKYEEGVVVLRRIADGQTLAKIGEILYGASSSQKVRNSKENRARRALKRLLQAHRKPRPEPIYYG